MQNKLRELTNELNKNEIIYSEQNLSPGTFISFKEYINKYPEEILLLICDAIHEGNLLKKVENPLVNFMQVSATTQRQLNEISWIIFNKICNYSA